MYIYLLERLFRKKLGMALAIVAEVVSFTPRLRSMSSNRTNPVSFSFSSSSSFLLSSAGVPSLLTTELELELEDEDDDDDDEEEDEDEDEVVLGLITGLLQELFKK